MNIIILPRKIALHLEPPKNSISIRIWEQGDADETDKQSDMKISPPEKYLACLNVWFDDIDSERIERKYGSVVYLGINAKIAQEILDFFEKYRNHAEHLIINCQAGISRSPAVALALNDLFELHALDKNDFLGNKKYSCFNRYVYKTICEQAVLRGQK